MKLQLDRALDADAMGRITTAVLKADLGSRINFEPDVPAVRIENWLSVADTVAAIARAGIGVAAVLDASNDMPRAAPLRPASTGWTGAAAAAA
jgi:hypothetical protein